MYYSPKTSTDGLVFHYDTGNTVRSYLGEPTTNYVPGTFDYGLYAYASGPVDTTVLNEKNRSITAKRYTITQAVNTARAAIFPTGLTTGVAYTFSFKWRYNGSTTASPSIGVSAAKGNPETNNNSFASQTGDTVSIGNGWYLTTYTFVFSSNPTGGSILTFGISTGSTSSYIGETFDIYEAQFEVKAHRTPYASGTRSATQGLKDLTGNRVIDLSNVSFNSNAQIIFDGTDDGVIVDTALNLSSYSGLTIEGVVKGVGVGEYDRWFSGTSGTTVHYPDLAITQLGELRYFFASINDGWVPTGVTVSTTSFNYLTYTFTTAGAVKIYVNGQLAYSTTHSAGTFPSVFRTMIGNRYDRNGEALIGEVPLTKIYNRALTADEVQRNFNAVKSRFNIA